MVDVQELRGCLSASVELLILEQWELAWLDVCERNITSHLFRYLANVMEGSGLDVDHEYNRRSNMAKALPFKVGDDDGERRIYPDLVIHRRNQRSNYMAIEAKKGARTDGLDDLKIGLLLSEAAFAYQCGVLLAFGTKARDLEPLQPFQAWSPSWDWCTRDARTGRSSVFDDKVLKTLNEKGWARWRERSAH